VGQRDFAVWDELPAGSRLYLRLEVNGAALARATAVRSSDGVGIEETVLSHVWLLDGGYAAEVGEGIGATATVTVHFPAARARAELTAAVVGPGGRPVGAPFRYAMAGSRGDTYRAILLLTTERLVPRRSAAD
jgi:hypothetical protein